MDINKISSYFRYKNGQEVSADARLKIFRDSKRSESYWMTLTIVKEQDAGVYEVRATNVLGSVESKSIVTVISEYQRTFSRDFTDFTPTFLSLGGNFICDKKSTFVIFGLMRSKYCDMVILLSFVI